MKSTTLLILMVCLISGGVRAGTIDVWKGPTGSFTDGTKWQNGGPSTWTSTNANDELKLTGEDTVCTVDIVGSWIYRLTVSSGPDGATLQVVNDGNLSIGEVRVGSSGATGVGAIGYVSQTGGTLSVKDLILGRAGSTATGKGYYIISGGTLTYNSGATGRLYVGGGNGGTYTEGTLTIVENAASIQMKALYVGSENGTNYGKGTLVFQVGASGVSPIGVADAVFLDTAGTSSIANLEVSTTESSLPQTDILLVHVTSGNALTGTFDAMNGGSAAEGTQIILAGNTYSLTYQYAAEAGANNDIALVFVGGAVTHHKAYTPVPADGATVDTTLALLDWINADPNIPGNPVYCDVYLGTEPNRLSMDKVTLGNNISQVNINTTNFPTYGNLQDATQYYWAVDVHDGNDLLSGDMWSFLVNNNEAPIVNAGPDQVSWLGKSSTPGQEIIALDGTTSDDGNYTVLWTQVANGAPTVVITPNNVDDTSVTITARGTYVFMLTADDGTWQTSDTVQIIVGSTSCDASHMSTGAVYDAEDQNHDCIVDLADFAALITDDWLTCTDWLTNCSN
jgi:hypothetical protein